MAMNVGKPADSEPEVMIDINTTPLIDVMLVLLVMLIITIPIQLHSVNLNMPIGQSAAAARQAAEVVKIDIDPRARVYWNGEALPDRADARGEARRARPRKRRAARSCTCGPTRTPSTRSSPA